MCGVCVCIWSEVRRGCRAVQAGNVGGGNQIKHVKGYVLEDRILERWRGYMY